MITFNKIQPSDWNAVKEIYEEGIATGNATFQQFAPEWEDWDKSHLQHSRLIVKEDTIV